MLLIRICSLDAKVILYDTFSICYILSYFLTFYLICYHKGALCLSPQIKYDDKKNGKTFWLYLIIYFIRQVKHNKIHHTRKKWISWHYWQFIFQWYAPVMLQNLLKIVRQILQRAVLVPIVPSKHTFKPGDEEKKGNQIYISNVNVNAIINSAEYGKVNWLELNAELKNCEFVSLLFFYLHFHLFIQWVVKIRCLIMCRDKQSD